MPEHQSEGQSIGRKLLSGWIAIAGRFGAVQTQVLLGFFYFLLIGPFWLGTSLARRDFLTKRGLGSTGTAFAAADTAVPDLERAKLTS